MSREIKFRAWNGEQMVSPDYITRDGIGYWREDSIPCYSEDLMQFTGLRDKNGIDIYEGDIVTESSKYGWEKEVVSMRFVGASDDMGIDVFGYPDFDSTAEVIGNIHENKN